MKTRHSFGRVTGTVAAFAVSEGAGVVTDGVTEWPFHCTQIEGGARSIPVGTSVSFDLVAGLPGRWDAVSLTASGGAFLCPACGSSVVGEQGNYDICDGCEWEDDPSQRDDTGSTGANKESLSAARSTVVAQLISVEHNP